MARWSQPIHQVLTMALFWGSLGKYFNVESRVRWFWSMPMYMFPKVFDHETAANGCDPKDPNHGGFHKWVIPNGWMVYIIQHNVTMDDLGLPTPFEETAICQLQDMFPPNSSMSSVQCLALPAVDSLTWAIHTYIMHICIIFRLMNNFGKNFKSPSTD